MLLDNISPQRTSPFQLKQPVAWLHVHSLRVPSQPSKKRIVVYNPSQRFLSVRFSSGFLSLAWFFPTKPPSAFCVLTPDPRRRSRPPSTPPSNSPCRLQPPLHAAVAAAHAVVAIQPSTSRLQPPLHAAASPMSTPPPPPTSLPAANHDAAGQHSVSFDHGGSAPIMPRRRLPLRPHRRAGIPHRSRTQTQLPRLRQDRSSHLDATAQYLISVCCIWNYDRQTK